MNKNIAQREYTIVNPTMFSRPHKTVIGLRKAVNECLRMGPGARLHCGKRCVAHTNTITVYTGAACHSFGGRTGVVQGYVVAPDHGADTDERRALERRAFGGSV